MNETVKKTVLIEMETDTSLAMHKLKIHLITSQITVSFIEHVNMTSINCICFFFSSMFCKYYIIVSTYHVPITPHSWLQRNPLLITFRLLITHDWSATCGWLRSGYFPLIIGREPTIDYVPITLHLWLVDNQRSDCKLSSHHIDM